MASRAAPLRFPGTARWGRMPYALAGLLAAVIVALGIADRAHAHDLKIGYVDMKRLLDNAPQVVAGRERLDREFRQRDQAIREREADLEDLEDRLRRDSAVMSREERVELERRIRSLRREIRRDREDLRDELDMRLNEEYTVVQEEIKQTIAALAEEQGFDLVVPSPVAYASDTIDITDQVLQRLRREFEAESKDLPE